MARIATFAERLKGALEMRQITKAELSRITGISKSSLTRYTKGDWEGKQDAVFAIAQALDVSEAWLMGYDVPIERSWYDDKQLIYTAIDTAMSSVYNTSKVTSEFRIGCTALFPDDSDAEKTVAELEMLGYEIAGTIKDDQIKVADKRTEEIVLAFVQDFKDKSSAPKERALKIAQTLQKEKDTLYALYQLADERDQNLVNQILEKYQDDLDCKTYNCEKFNPKK